MEWKRIKKILIIALIIANVVLFLYIRFNDMRFKDESTTRGFTREVISLLSEKNIKVDTKIPRKINKLPSVFVEFQTFSEDKVNQDFFDGKGKITRPSTDLAEISLSGEYINLVNNRRIYYENRVNKENFKNIDNLEKAQEIAKKFMLDKKIDIRDIYLSSYDHVDGKYFLNYTKKFENIPVESSYTNFIIDRRGVMSMDRLWLNVLNKSEQKIFLYPAPKALLYLLNKDEYFNKTIEKISPCFYFNPEDQGYIEDITRAVNGRAIPAWKIEFSDGEYTVIDNY